MALAHFDQSRNHANQLPKYTPFFASSTFCMQTGRLLLILCSLHILYIDWLHLVFVSCEIDNIGKQKVNRSFLYQRQKPTKSASIRVFIRQTTPSSKLQQTRYGSGILFSATTFQAFLMSFTHTFYYRYNFAPINFAQIYLW